MRPAASLALATLLLAACPGGSQSTDTDATTGGASTTTGGTTVTVTTTTTTASTGPGTATGVDPTTGPGSTTSGTTDPGTVTHDTDIDPPPAPAIHYVGRHDAGDPDHVRMGWSGVGLVVRFNGTGASVGLDDQGRYHTVVIDGQVQPQPLATAPGEQSYPLASGLSPGEHTVELYRRTEGSFGPTVVTGVTLEGELLAPPSVTRRIEIVGDSITCGYGNEGEAPCSFSAETENHFLTYGAVAARAVAAELSTVAWSGKGVIYNYGDDKNEPLPQLYDRTIAVEAAPWGFTWQPDVVVINLGTNDFSTDDDPSQELFVGAYVDFLAHVREVNPTAFILVVAPVLFGDEAVMVQGYLEAVVDQRHQAGDADVAFADINVAWIGSGCDGHPSLATHAEMGARLVEALQLHLGW